MASEPETELDKAWRGFRIRWLILTAIGSAIILSACIR
jgi:hypothetical protein